MADAPKNRAEEPNRKFGLSRSDSAYNFMNYVDPDGYTSDERKKSAELIENVNKQLFPDSPFIGKFTKPNKVNPGA
jgi:hypothetical protein